MNLQTVTNGVGNNETTNSIISTDEGGYTEYGIWSKMDANGFESSNTGTKVKVGNGEVTFSENAYLNQIQLLLSQYGRYLSVSADPNHILQYTSNVNVAHTEIAFEEPTGYMGTFVFPDIGNNSEIVATREWISANISGSGITTVTGIAPITVADDGSGGKIIGINKSDIEHDGYLSYADWNIFNDKLTDSPSDGVQYIRKNGTWESLGNVEYSINKDNSTPITNSSYTYPTSRFF